MKSCPTGTHGVHEGDWENVREDGCTGNMDPRQTGLQVMLGFWGPPAWKRREGRALLDWKGLGNKNMAAKKDKREGPWSRKD